MSQATAPPAIQSEGITAQIIRDRIWRPAALGNDWRVFAIVGREGTGKSLTCASILAACDPSFGVENTHFDPVPFLQDVAKETDRPAVAAMSDESGVAFGNRTWYDREQVEANQALQTARDYNRILGLTAPRLEEIDKQLQGRLHVLIETVGKRDGQWVEVKWKEVDPSRSGENKIYKKYPRVRTHGRVQKVTRLKIGLPPEGFIEGYLEKKAEWKARLFDRVIGRYEQDQEEAQALHDASEIVDDILENGTIEEYISYNNGHPYLDKDLIAVDYAIGEKKSKRVKKALLREVDVEDVA